MSTAGTSPTATQSSHICHFPAALWVLLALTAAVRMFGITRPLLGNFATRNVVYAMVARNWANGTAGIWYPTLDILKGGQRSLIMLEFPVSAYLTAWLWKTLGGSLDAWGRATAVAFSVASVALIFLFVRRRHGTTVATAAALALAISPVGVIYGQSFMLEASLVCFTLGTFSALDRWIDGRRIGWLLATAVCLALLLLTKIYMLVVLLPLAVAVVRAARSTGQGVSDEEEMPETSLAAESPSTTANRPAILLAFMAAVLAILPAACWYIHAARTASPEGPFGRQIYFSVRRSVVDHYPPHPLLCSPDFHCRALDNLAGVVLTPVGFVLLLAGFLDRKWRQYAAWLLAMVVLVLALPRKFHEMDYYYMAVLPPLCVMVGLGWQVVCRQIRPSRTAVAVVLLAAMAFSLRYALRPAFVTPDEDRGVVAAGRAVRELTADEEPVVAMHGTTIDLLYYCHRPGWAVAPDAENLQEQLSGFWRQGARYLVVVGNEPPEAVGTPVVSAEHYRIYLLHDPPN